MANTAHYKVATLRKKYGGRTSPYFNHSEERDQEELNQEGARRDAIVEARDLAREAYEQYVQEEEEKKMRAALNPQYVMNAQTRLAAADNARKAAEANRAYELYQAANRDIEGRIEEGSAPLAHQAPRNLMDMTQTSMYKQGEAIAKAKELEKRTNPELMDADEIAARRKEEHTAPTEENWSADMFDNIDPTSLRELRDKQKAKADSASWLTPQEALFYSEDQIGKQKPEVQAKLGRLGELYSALNGLREPGEGETGELSDMLTEQAKLRREITEEVGEDKAKDLFGYVSTVRNAQDTQKRTEKVTSDIQNGGLGATLAHNATSIAPFLGASSIFANLNDRPQGFPVDTNSPSYAFTNYGQAVQEATNEKIAENEFLKDRGLTGAAQFAYGAGYSAAKSTVSQLSSIALAGALGLTGNAAKIGVDVINLAPISAESYATALKEAQDRGLSPDEAQKVAGASGVIEALTEIVGLGNLTETAGLDRKAAKHLLTNALMQAGLEGSEEVAGDILNTVVDEAVTGENSKLNTRIKELEAEGMSERDARMQAGKEWAIDTAKDFFSGALSGGMSTLGATAYRYTTDANKANEMFEGTSMNDWKESLDTDRGNYETEEAHDAAKRAYEHASKLAEKEEAGKKISTADKRELMWDIQEAQQGYDNSVDVPDEEISTPKEYRTSKELNANDMFSRMGSAQTAEKLVNVEKEARLSGDKGVQDLHESWYRTNMSRLQSEGKATQEEIDAAMEAPTTREEAFQAGARGERLENLSPELAEANSAGLLAKQRLDTTQSIEDTSSLKDVSFEMKGKKVIANNAENLDSAGARLIEGAQRQNSEAGARTFTENYPAGMPIGTYERAFNTIYGVGASNTMSAQDLSNSNELKLAKRWMSDEQIKSIYQMGQDETKQELISNAEKKGQSIAVIGTGTVTGEEFTSPESFTVAKAIAAGTGIDIHFSADARANINGTFDRSISAAMINSKNDSRELNAMFHEGFGEFLHEFNPEGSEKIQRAFMQYVIDTKGVDEFVRIGKNYQRAYQGVEGTKSFWDSYSEATNDMYAGLFSTEEGVKDFTDYLYKKNASEAKGVLQTVADYLKHLADAFKKLLSRSNLTETARIAAEMGEKRAREFRKMVLKEIDAAERNMRNTTIKEESADSRRFSAEVTFNGQTAKVDSNGNFATVEGSGRIIPIISEADFTRRDVKKEFSTVRSLLREEMLKLRGRKITIKSDGSVVLADKKFANEYAYSKDTQNTRLTSKRAKANIYDKITDIVENAINPRWTQNTKPRHAKEASRGWRYYDVAFAINENGLSGYGGKLNVRMDADGSDYIYDITEIKKVPVESHMSGGTAVANETETSNENIPHQNAAVNGDKPSINPSDNERSFKDAHGTQRLSVQTYEDGGRDTLQEFLENSNLTERDQNDILEAMDWGYKIAKEFSNNADLGSFGKWSSTKLTTAEDGTPLVQVIAENTGRPIQSVVVQNGEYPLNIDFTQVCKKRVTLNTVLNTLIDQYGLNLRTITESDINKINKLIKDHGFEIACGLCFVDAKRYRVGKWASSFTDGTVSKDGKKTKVGWNDLVKSMLPDGVSADYFNFATNAATPAGTLLSDLDESQANFKTLKKAIGRHAEKDANGNIIGIKSYKDANGTSHSPTEIVRMAYALMTKPELRHLLDQNDIIASEGLDAMREKNYDLYQIVNAHWGAGKPKLPHGYTAYGNEILRSANWGAANDFNKESAAKVGGVRVQSFSDYVANMFFDYMQMFADMSARELTSHAYTKEINYVKLFGMTGQKINMSIVPKAVELTPEQEAHLKTLKNKSQRDADPLFQELKKHAGLKMDSKGEWQYIIEDETFPLEEALKIQKDPRYNKNCGIIWVGVSDAHIFKMLDDDNVPMIIPYHASGVSQLVKKARNIELYTDYTKFQNTRTAEGGKVSKDFDFYGDLAKTNDVITTTNNYLAWCKENKYIPKFSKFAKHPNYYKLLIDFRAYDYNGSDPNHVRTYQPQESVKMNFPDNFKEIVLESLKEQQATEDALIDELTDEQGRLLKEVKDALGLKEGGERYSVNAVDAAENVKRHDYSYDALKKKDPIHIYSVDDLQLTTFEGVSDVSRRDVLDAARNNIANYNKRVGKDFDNKALFNKDLGVPVAISDSSLRHGLTRIGEQNTSAVTSLPAYFENAIVINEADGMRKSAAFSYVLAGAYEHDGIHIARALVNHYADGFRIDEINDALYSVSTKKEEAALNGAKAPGKSPAFTSSNWSITQLLNAVKECYPDELSEDVANHLLYKRGGSVIEGLRYSVEVDDFWNDTNNFTDETVAESAKNTASILEEGMKATGDVSKATVQKIATELRDRYGSTYSRTELADNLEKVFAYAKENDVSYDDFLRVLGEVARPVIDEATEKVGQEAYDDFLNNLSGYKIALTERQKEEVIRQFGSYRAFQTAMKGIEINENGTKLDALWNEIADRTQGILDYDVAEGDMPIALADALTSLKPVERSIYEAGYSEEEAAHDLALDILQRYFEAEGDVKTAQEIKKNSAKFRAKIKEGYDARLKNAKARMKENNDRYRERMKQRYNERYQNAKENLKEKNKAYRERLDERTADRMADFRARAKNSRLRVKEMQERRKQRTEAEKIAKALYTMATEPTEQKHIPNPMLKPVIEFINALDFVTPAVRQNADGKWTATVISYDDDGNQIRNHFTGDTQAEVLEQIRGQGGTRNQNAWKERLRNIREIYLKAQTGEQFGDANMDGLIEALDQGVAAEIGDIIDKYDGLPMSSLTSEELKSIKNMLQNIRHAVNVANKAFTSSAKMSDLAEETMKFAEGKHLRKDKTRFMNAVTDFLSLDMATPETFFHIIGSGKIYKMLRDGFDQKARHLKEAQSFMEDTVPESVRKKMKEISGKDAKVHSFDIADGNIKLTTAQIMSLYVLNKRQQAMLHRVGGFRPGTITDKKGIQRNQEAVHLTDAEIERITGTLTEDQKVLADKMQEFMAVVCAKWGNETARIMFGYDKFGDPHYFPIQSDNESIATTDKNESPGLINGLKNMGFTKKVVANANNAIMINDIFDVFTNHVNDMIAYNAYAPAISDAIRWFNFRDIQTDENGNNYETNVKKAIRKIAGVRAEAYFKKLVADLNQSEQSSYIKPPVDFVSKYKVAAIGFNARVVIQQPTAIVRAAGMINGKYLLSGLSAFTSLRKTSERMQEESPIAWWKSQGYFESSVGKSMKEIITGVQSPRERLQELSLAAAGVADDVTWGVIYTAVEREQRDVFRKAGKEANGQEYRDAVNDRFREIIDRTQVVDATLLRSQYMRSADTLNKIKSSFMAEPTKSYNTLMRGYVDGVKGEGWGGFTKAAAAFTATSLVNALAQSVLDALRGAGEDDDKFWDRYKEAYVDNAFDNMNIFNLLPWVKDLVSLVQDLKSGGYGSNNSQMDTAAVENMLMAAKGTIEFFSGNSNKTMYGMLYANIRALSQITGVPVYNLTRDLNAVYNTARENFKDLPDLFRKQIKKSGKYNSLTNAIKKGKGIEEAIYNLMEEDGVIKDVQSAISGKFKQDYYEMYIEDPKQVEELEKNVIAAYMATGMTEDEATSVVNEWRDPSIGYNYLDDAIEAQEGIADAVKLLQEDGKKDSAIQKHVVKRYGSTLRYYRAHGMTEDLYITEEAISEALKTAGAGSPKSLIESMYDASLEDATESDFKYDALTKAFNGDGDPIKAIDETLAGGTAPKTIATRLTSEYKPVYLDLYKSNKSEAAALQQKLVKCYVYLGKKQGKKYGNKDPYEVELKRVQDWLK